MTARVIAYIAVGLFCAGGLFSLLRTFVFRDRWRHNKKIDLTELRRIDIEYGQKQDRDDRFKR
jgi:hypothetical protein